MKQKQAHKLAYSRGEKAPAEKIICDVLTNKILVILVIYFNEVMGFQECQLYSFQYGHGSPFLLFINNVVMGFLVVLICFDER